MSDHIDIIADWQKRLAALMEASPSVSATPGKSDAVAAESRKMLAFEGYPEDLLSAAEDRLWAPLPKLFRRFMATMGRQPGPLFANAKLASPAEFGQFRCDALELLADTDIRLELPYRAVVFLFDTPNRFYLMVAEGQDDGPVLTWASGDGEMSQAADSFKAFIDAEIAKIERAR